MKRLLAIGFIPTNTNLNNPTYKQPSSKLLTSQLSYEEEV